MSSRCPCCSSCHLEYAEIKCPMLFALLSLPAPLRPQHSRSAAGGKNRRATLRQVGEAPLPLGRAQAVSQLPAANTSSRHARLRCRQLGLKRNALFPSERTHSVKAPTGKPLLALNQRVNLLDSHSFLVQA